MMKVHLLPLLNKKNTPYTLEASNNKGLFAKISTRIKHLFKYLTNTL